MCFLGARSYTQSANQVDTLLSPGEDLNTLLTREENYRKFQSMYLAKQTRKPTPDGLGYASLIVVDDVRLAVVGLDSAWLAEGGASDHGKLLIGERQVIDALMLAQQLEPHLTIAMAHHPFHVLQDFDRRTTQRRIEQSCLFFHCGHLHEPEARTAGLHAAGCLTLAAGAAFETRQSQNSYTIATVDLLRGKRSARTLKYVPSEGRFKAEAEDEFPIEIPPAAACTVPELAAAMTAYRPSLSTWAHYLSALLLDQKGELPIPVDGGYIFGSVSPARAD
jgi:hypothetical protein